MVEMNWDVFNLKFSGRTREKFEWFCYMLFCVEHGYDKGIFRFFNQAAIETDPVVVEGETVGWQAKYFDSTLSNHTGKIIETINKAKELYPDIDRLILYSNSEWAQYKGSKPKGLIEVEEVAKQNNMIIDWRLRSFFESKFVTIDNEIIAMYFFSLNENEFDEVNRRISHTNNLLSEIHNAIQFKESEIHISRSEVIERISDVEEQVIIISGTGGVGKTAVIKDIYNDLQEGTSLLLFKATEFELTNADLLFKSTSFNDFFEFYKSIDDKVIVIDSAEKLLDLRNTGTFRLLLSRVIKDKWKVILTSRTMYINDLSNEFLDIYNILPKNIHIDEMTISDLNQLSEEYSFILPKDFKLLKLIRNPFYLNEYLKYYQENDELDYQKFKEKLWYKNIKKSKPLREQWFMKVAHQRANTGQFFQVFDTETTILDEELLPDGLIGYESAGYFITHDIYEEWALERIIEGAFIKAKGVEDFIDSIGDSMPMRRVFRSWMSDKLFHSPTHVGFLLDGILKQENVNSYWKDELIVSVLLSPYAKTFFEQYKELLIANELVLLKRVGFLLRLACKELNNILMDKVDGEKYDLFNTAFVFTKPIGEGWIAFIDFTYNNIEQIGSESLFFVIPIINAWSGIPGIGTEIAGKIALNLYEFSFRNKELYIGKENEEELIATILKSANENKEILIKIIDEVVENNWKLRSDPYNALCRAMLTSKLGAYTAKVIPKSVIKIAKLFWLETEIERSSRFYNYSAMRIEQSFGLSSMSDRFYPSSSYQTPMYSVLHSAAYEGIDFIIELMNECVEVLVKSGFDSRIRKIYIELGDGERSEQFISSCLWNIYRGNGSPVSPNLLQSLHMALEKFLLDVAEKTDDTILISLFKNMLRKSNSASITAVILSVVLAYPEKLSDIAVMLFRTFEIIYFDLSRSATDGTVKNLYSIGYGMNSEHDIYQKERIDTCDQEHRKKTLEGTIVTYQFFMTDGGDEAKFKARQSEIWDILDYYYKDFEKGDYNDGSTKELIVRRMDRRIMDPKFETVDEGILIDFNPQLPKEIVEFSNQAKQESDEKSKYLRLDLWAKLKLDNDQKADGYEEYDIQPGRALEEVKQFMEEMKEGRFDEYDLMYRSLLPNVCSVLIIFYIDILSEQDFSLVKDIVIGYASAPTQKEYGYQIGDGVEAAVRALPFLFGKTDSDNDLIVLLLKILLNQYPLGSYKRICDYAIEAINETLWKQHPQIAKKITLCYLTIAPEFSEFVERKRSAAQYSRGDEFNTVYMDFIESHERMVEALIGTEVEAISVDDVVPSITMVEMILSLIPYDTQDSVLLEVIENLIREISEDIFEESRAEDYSDKHKLFKEYSKFLLTRNKNEIGRFNRYFVQKFIMNRESGYLFDELLLAENLMNTFDTFWVIWWSYYDRIIECSKGRVPFYGEEVIQTYTLASRYWKSGATEWHSLRAENSDFYKRITTDLSNSPEVLAGISSLLYSIGSLFLDDGIPWISSMLMSNPEVHMKEMSPNTIFYLENILRKYINKHRETLKTNIRKKEEVLVILNCLVEKNSEVAYMIRERLV